jgi:hypothetical protein
MQQISACTFVDEVNPIEIQVEQAESNNFFLEDSNGTCQQRHGQFIEILLFFLMIFLVKVVKYEDLILGDELEQTEAVFLDKPCDKLSDALLFELENVKALFIFAV